MCVYFPFLYISLLIGIVNHSRLQHHCNHSNLISTTCSTYTKHLVKVCLLNCQSSTYKTVRVFFFTILLFPYSPCLCLSLSTATVSPLLPYLSSHLCLLPLPQTISSLSSFLSTSFLDSFCPLTFCQAHLTPLVLCLSELVQPDRSTPWATEKMVKIQAPRGCPCLSITPSSLPPFCS